MNKELEKVITRPDTWVAKQYPDYVSKNKGTFLRSKSLSTGFDSMDKVLHLSGWPLGTNIELIGESHVNGNMSLLIPAMKSLSHQNRWHIFIAPPYVPYAPMLTNKGIDAKKILLIHPKTKAELLWSAEQALRSKTCSTVFSWLGPVKYEYNELQKLHLAAKKDDVLSVFFIEGTEQTTPTPSVLRLLMSSYEKITVLKQRGGKQNITVQLPSREYGFVQSQPDACVLKKGVGIQ